MPLGVVLTIPATGSEASNTTVVTNSENGHMKRALSHECLRPDFALMNPELTYTLPAYQTAAGGVDILSHIMERYFTNEEDCELTDRQCEALYENSDQAVASSNGETRRLCCQSRSDVGWYNGT